ncbi:hypothetical protein ACVWZA_002381 [Sphingomonas sp. UYAg733]
MIGLLTSEMFEPHIGSAFSVRVGDHADVLTLVEVGELLNREPDTSRPPFTLSFTGASTETLFDQQMLALDHPVMGVNEIMLTPCGRDADRRFCYEAVFN